MKKSSCTKGAAVATTKRETSKNNTSKMLMKTQSFTSRESEKKDMEIAKHATVVGKHVPSLTSDVPARTQSEIKGYLKPTASYLAKQNHRPKTNQEMQTLTSRKARPSNKNETKRVHGTPKEVAEKTVKLDFDLNSTPVEESSLLESAALKTDASNGTKSSHETLNESAEVKLDIDSNSTPIEDSSLLELHAHQKGASKGTKTGHGTPKESAEVKLDIDINSAERKTISDVVDEFKRVNLEINLNLAAHQTEASNGAKRAHGAPKESAEKIMKLDFDLNCTSVEESSFLVSAAHQSEASNENKWNEEKRELLSKLEAMAESLDAYQKVSESLIGDIRILQQQNHSLQEEMAMVYMWFINAVQKCQEYKEWIVSLENEKERMQDHMMQMEELYCQYHDILFPIWLRRGLRFKF